MRNRTFHQARIAGMLFEGILAADGPYLSCQTAGGVALGVSGLRHFQPPPDGRRRLAPEGWWVVKYREEERIFLPGFSLANIRRLSDEFGLVVLAESNAPEPTHRLRQDYFFTSPAWEALRHWVARHPRLAKTHATCDAYLGGWYGRAIVEAAALAT
jgi:hypothetical protein